MSRQKYQLTFILIASYINPAWSAGLVATPDARSTFTNTPITINVLDNDSSSNQNSFSLVSVGTPSHGTASLNDDGGVIYTPDEGYVGKDAFTYTIAENTEGGSSASATVALTVAPFALQDFVSSTNDKNFAAALNSACEQISSDNSETPLNTDQAKLAATCQALNALKLTGATSLTQTLHELSPQKLLALRHTAQAAIKSQSHLISQRTAKLGGGIKSVSINGVALGAPLQGGSAGDLQTEFNFFASAEIQDADKPVSDFEDGYAHKANTLVAGFDYGLTAVATLGLAVGATQNSLDYDAHSGSVDTKLYSVLGFSSYRAGNFLLDIQAGYGDLGFDVERKITLNQLLSQQILFAKGSVDGKQALFSISAEYDSHWSALEMAYFGRYLYNNTAIQGYQESNLNGLDLTFNKQSIDQQEISAGLRSQYSLNVPWGVLAPTLSLELINSLSNATDDIKGKFIYGLDEFSFLVKGEKPDGFYLDAALGLSLQFTGGIGAYCTYSQILDNDNYSSQQLQAGIRLEL